MEKEKLAKLLENCPYLDILGGLSYWDEAAEYLLANGVRLEENQATSDKTSDKTSKEQSEEIYFDYAAEDDNV